MSRREPSALCRLILASSFVATVAACAAPTNVDLAGLPSEAAQPSGAASPAAGAGSPSPSGASTDPFVAWPAFAACLRAYGLDVADPELDAVGEPHWGDDLKRSLTQPVRAACAPIIAIVDEGGTLRGHGVPSYSFDSLVAHAACLRAQGLSDWPDPDANTTNWVWPADFGRTDPRVIAALDSCEGTLVGTQASPSPGS